MFKARNPLINKRVNPAFHGDVCFEYDDWCAQHVKPKKVPGNISTKAYYIHNIGAVDFQRLSDMNAFILRFWGLKILEEQDV